MTSVGDGRQQDGDPGFNTFRIAMDPHSRDCGKARNDAGGDEVISYVGEVEPSSPRLLPPLSSFGSLGGSVEGPALAQLDGGSLTSYLGRE